MHQFWVFSENFQSFPVTHSLEFHRCCVSITWHALNEAQCGAVAGWQGGIEAGRCPSVPDLGSPGSSFQLQGIEEKSTVLPWIWPFSSKQNKKQWAWNDGIKSEYTRSDDGWYWWYWEYWCPFHAALEVLMPLTEGGLQYLMAAARGNAEGLMWMWKWVRGQGSKVQKFQVLPSCWCFQKDLVSQSTQRCSFSWNPFFAASGWSRIWTFNYVILIAHRFLPMSM